MSMMLFLLVQAIILTTLKPERPSNEYQFDFILEQWVDTKTDEIRAEEALEALRRERNIKLAMSDWTQLPDSPLNEEQKVAWAEYRQALRDIVDSFSTTTQPQAIHHRTQA
jgi:hypothetical protein